MDPSTYDAAVQRACAGGQGSTLRVIERWTIWRCPHDHRFAYPLTGSPKWCPGCGTSSLGQVGVVPASDEQGAVDGLIDDVDTAESLAIEEEAFITARVLRELREKLAAMKGQ